jgi:hypothetical protein
MYEQNILNMDYNEENARGILTKLSLHSSLLWFNCELRLRYELGSNQMS